MSGRRFFNQVVKKVQYGENLEDVIVMIDILAYERSIALGDWLSDRVYEYAAGILCIILDPVKPAPFTENMISLRRSFKGIHISREHRERFRKSFTNELLITPSVEEAVSLRFDQLFLGPMAFGQLEATGT